MNKLKSFRRIFSPGGWMNKAYFIILIRQENIHALFFCFFPNVMRKQSHIRYTHMFSTIFATSFILKCYEILFIIVLSVRDGFPALICTYDEENKGSAEGLRKKKVSTTFSFFLFGLIKYDLYVYIIFYQIYNWRSV